MAWYTTHTFNYLNCFMSWPGILYTLSISWNVACLSLVYYPHFQFLELFHVMAWYTTTLSISWTVSCHGLVYYSHFQLLELFHVLAWYTIHTFNFLNCFMSWPGILSTHSITDEICSLSYRANLIKTIKFVDDVLVKRVAIFLSSF